mmetsp:Transcript_2406/g.4404  ORF Transcript_2406/g.4404 Transcript_2406/m.4404 type:complete len:335 (+) Transcript_2406:83-1087(+)
MKRVVSSNQPPVVKRLKPGAFTCPVTKLANGVEVPKVGFGTAFFPEGRREPEVVWEALPKALEAGMCHIDTAHMYGNERHIGEMLGRRIEAGELSRTDVFITTKVGHPPVGLWPEPSDGETAYMQDPSQHAGAGLTKQFQGCLRRLGLGYVDLLLIHWPGPYNGQEAVLNKEKRIQMWAAMEELYERRLARSIGVSNFTEEHLKDILPGCKVKPHMNQIEMHPFLSQNSLRKFCMDNDIALTAYSPLAGGKVDSLIKEPAILDAAVALKAKPGQIVLKWLMQRGAVVIPKSSSIERMRENLAAASLPDLSEEQLKRIEALDEGLHTCSDPNNIS